MKASEIDRRFEDGEDVSDLFDFSRARRPNRDVRRVNLDLPVWVIDALDVESTRLGVTRQSLIKIWLAERLEHKAS
jgi:hypothetical protein